MEGFTENYNVVVKRVCYWHDILEHLLSAERLALNTENLSREDRRALRKIHKFLSETCRITEKQRDYHNRQLLRLRREYVNEG